VEVHVEGLRRRHAIAVIDAASEEALITVDPVIEIALGIYAPPEDSRRIT